VDVEIEFQVHRHPRQSLARIEVQGRTIILKEGEWSDWQKVSFPLEMPVFLPNDEVPGICRFYLQQVRPHFRLYVSPVNVDPSDPAQQISEPPEFVTKISDRLGLFYTTGFQEDHKARRHNVFTDEEYLEQANYVLAERMNLLEYALEHYQDGLLFFYFSSTDLQAHMFWWDSDAKHPVRSPEEAKKYFGVMADLYRKMDAVVGDVVQRYGDATVMVVSDHGFCNFRRQFNINTWLRDNGYLGPSDCASLGVANLREPLVDWSRTQAYGLGLNALYLNLKGRERFGIVDASERDELLDELRAKLLAVRDPADGQPVMRAVYRSDQVYTGPFAQRAPDLIVGYRRGYRCSWASSLGTLSKNVIQDNDQAWSADHCMAAEELPGVVFATKPIVHEAPALIDMAPTILEEFGLTPPRTMAGRSVFRST
jgi:predicted AlkP superfamily phosphohydrolase/phosphomutase